MIKHIVFFKFKPDLSEEQLNTFVSATAEIPKAIPLAMNWYDGRNVSPRDKTYDYGVVCDFADWDAFHQYIDHPVHQAFIREYLQTMTVGRAVVDFEF